MPTVVIPNTSVILVAETCYRCAIVFAVPNTFQRNRLEDKESFFCPNGHSQAYVESRADRLERDLKAKADELARVRAYADQREARVRELYEESAHKDRRINGYKGVVARTKRRVSKGVCPCCSAKFKDLKVHMQTQHPGWDPDRAAEVTGAKSA